MKTINLILLGTPAAPLQWKIGTTFHSPRDPKSLCELLSKEITTSTADAWLFWDAELGQPDEKAIQEILSHPGDVWHAGIKLGLAGKPELIDFIQPTWMLNCDAPVEAASSSWRVTLRACLVKTDVLRRLSGPDPAFDSLAGAGLDWGLRLLKSGVLLRYEPQLVAGGRHPQVMVPAEDQYRIVRRWAGRGWADWALGRAVMEGQLAFTKAFQARQMYSIKLPASTPCADSFHQLDLPVYPIEGRVSVLIPTLQRYPYLRILLDQLRRQTQPPEEIIIVDQTPLAERDAAIAVDFADLPLRMIYLDQPGQCSARNAGLQMARGDYILFLDDDVEVGPDVIQEHLATLRCFQADASAGTVHEPGNTPSSPEKIKIKISSVFPMGNTLVAKNALMKSGLFDLAYDHGVRADGDLGMRLYLSGALLVQNLDIDLLHHRAPRGGLRVHNARKVTYAASRNRLLVRHIPSPSEIYLMKRYFTPRQARERLLLSIFGTFSVRGSIPRKIAKVILSAVLLPDTLLKIQRNTRKAEAMLAAFQGIPALDSQPSAPDSACA